MADGAAFCSNCGQAFAVATTPVYSPAMAASVAVPVRGSAAAIPYYDGYGGTMRQFRPLDGKELRKNHHQYCASLYWIHHVGFHREKAGAARHAGGMFGAAAKRLKQTSESGGL